MTSNEIKGIDGKYLRSKTRKEGIRKKV